MKSSRLTRSASSGTLFPPTSTTASATAAATQSVSSKSQVSTARASARHLAASTSRRLPRPSASKGGFFRFESSRTNDKSRSAASASSSSPSVALDDEEKAFDLLDFSPKLGFVEKGVVLLAGAVGFGIAFFRKPVVSFGCVAFSCVTGILAVAVTRYLLRERLYSRVESFSPQDVGDSSSRFERIRDILVHYKVEESGGGNAAEVVMHCSHGFGANLYSWEAVKKGLASRLNAMFVAHDTPGFGLTERPRSIDDFTLKNNSRIGLELLRTLGDKGSGTGGMPKAIFVGHSMGSISASYSAVQKHRQGENVKALILVAPAIRAKLRGGGDFRPKKSGINKKSLVAKLALVLGQKLSLLLIQPILLVVLRSIVRNRAFWQKGLESAWFNASKVTPEVIDGYRKAKLVRGWDVGMVKFVFAMLFSMNSKESASLLTQVVEAADSGLPVLIVHGEHDRIVPLANSLALEKVIPNCQLAILRGTGHNCHEEAPLEFIDIVADFLKTLSLI